MAIAALFIISLGQVFSFVDTPIYTADEIGYLNNALALAGNVFDGELKYYHGYSFIIAPFFVLLPNLESGYDAVQLFNKFCCLLNVLLAFHITRTLFSQFPIQLRLSVAMVVAMYPSLHIYSNLALSENLLVTQALFLILLFFWNSKHKIWQFVIPAIVGFILSWIYFTHPRVSPVTYASFGGFLLLWATIKNRSQLLKTYSTFLV
ncbi:MAG: hypothetical protein AAFR14_09605, partial [Bacteroidota bacterium]